MSCERIYAAQARAWGMVDFVVDDADLDSRALEIASKIAARPPIHVAMAKQLIDGVHGDQIRRGIREELVAIRSEEHTSELQSLMRISYAVFCLKKTNKDTITCTHKYTTQEQP